MCLWRAEWCLQSTRCLCPVNVFRQAVNCSLPCGDGKALSSTYFYGGEPMLRNGAHSSTEPANLALLAYDARIQTEWFPD